MTKKIVFLFIAALGLQTINAQDESKGFRFGLRIDPSLNWYTVDNDKKFENAGSGLGFGWGAHFEIKLSDNASWANGIGVMYDKGKINFSDASNADSTYYLLNKDDEVIEFPGANHRLYGTDTSLYLLTTRTYSVNYINLQSCIKMKTKEIGYLTYFGQFGLNVGIKTKARANDEASKFDLNASSNWSDDPQEKIDITNDMKFMKVAINIGFGFEFNISGSTSMFACVSYNHGLSNALTKNSDFLRKVDRKALPDPDTYGEIEQKATARNIALTIGILF